MKKLFIASAIAMTMAAGSAMAANQQAEVQFLGVVTNTTCDVSSTVNGNTTSTVQLGTVALDGTGTPVEFALKAADPSAAGCEQLKTQTASVTWQGPFITEGLGNGKGSATDAKMELKTVNAKDTPEQAISNAKTTVEFNGADVLGNGLKFTATLKGGKVAGTFDSAAAYAVTYK
ncbi:fimbrial protein [Salmonella enterica subsp. enterica serovar Braenderup]|nr:fimbrial protein [Salmonella enterica subsp. enterica serovar Braenderup]EHM7742174.1 fimbrial protein [Salmonella enterica subsp. enterica serovar Braenderup]HCM3552943.1 fimbrial protein [Salmonella enterica subsp. enterica serovar Minnesota]